MATTVDALDHFALFQLGLGNAANAVGAKVGVSRLDASEAAQVLVALLLPFGDQVLVGYVLVETVLVQLLADGVALVVEIVNVSGLLVMDLEDGPKRFRLAFALVWRRLRLAHLLLQLLERRLNQVPALWRRFAFVSQRHRNRNTIVAFFLALVLGSIESRLWRLVTSRCCELNKFPPIGPHIADTSQSPRHVLGPNVAKLANESRHVICPPLSLLSAQQTRSNMAAEEEPEMAENG